MYGKSLILVLALAQAGAPRPPDIPFRARMIGHVASETAAVVDINRDGRLDIVSGDSWYEAPSWQPHVFRELGFSGNYIDAFSDLPVDVDGDGYMDIATVTWFAKKISWYRNPGKAGGRWVESVIHSGFNVEFAVLGDMDNDGQAREIVAQENGTGQAWYEVKDKAWVRHVVSDRTYGHGIGVGDVNKDGRNDILTPRGWLEAPADPRAGGWTHHAAWESANGPITRPEAPAKPAAAGAPPAIASLGLMHVLDVNGDGLNDVITAAGHDFGVFWFEQGVDGTWAKRLIDGAWSQGHASTVVDLNGDGRLDFVTGKRFMTSPSCRMARSSSACPAAASSARCASSSVSVRVRADPAATRSICSLSPVTAPSCSEAVMAIACAWRPASLVVPTIASRAWAALALSSSTPDTASRPSSI
jgi:hypothetical protein